MGQGKETFIKNVMPSDGKTVLFDNMVSTKVKKGDILKELGIDSPAHFRKAPIICSECGSNHITGLEIIGAYRGTLLWECDYCGKLFLRFGRRKTEDLLESLRGTWINPNDWSSTSDDEAN